MITFEEWLVRHKNRNSPLGDLASDFIRTGDKLCDEEHLSKWKACDDARRTYKAARRQFKRYSRMSHVKARMGAEQGV